jgi:hypothetical protein
VVRAKSQADDSEPAVARLSVSLRRAAYPVVTATAVAIAIAGQLVEDLNDSPPLQMLPPTMQAQRWTVVALVVYSVVMAWLLNRTLKSSMSAVRDVVLVDDAAFDSYRRRSAGPTLMTELALLGFSAVIALVLFVGLGADLLIDDPVTRQPHGLPSQPLAAFVVLAGYTFIGWALWRLFYVAVRMGRLLGRLSREPLRINVFDTDDLVPFGNIALAVAFAPAGLIVLLLIGLGAPTTLVSWSVLVEATVVTLLALLLPLRGVHHQMSIAKDAALANINTRITELYETVSRPLPTDPVEATRIGATTSALIPLRKTIQEMTTWPFRNTVAFGRAVLIASAPLIYTTLSELIRVFVIGPISP